MSHVSRAEQATAALVARNCLVELFRICGLNAEATQGTPGDWLVDVLSNPAEPQSGVDVGFGIEYPGITCGHAGVSVAQVDGYWLPLEIMFSMVVGDGHDPEYPEMEYFMVHVCSSPDGWRYEFVSWNDPSSATPLSHRQRREDLLLWPRVRLNWWLAHEARRFFYALPGAWNNELT